MNELTKSSSSLSKEFNKKSKLSFADLTKTNPEKKFDNTQIELNAEYENYYDCEPWDSINLIGSKSYTVMKPQTNTATAMYIPYSILPDLIISSEKIKNSRTYKGNEDVYGMKNNENNHHLSQGCKFTNYPDNRTKFCRLFIPSNLSLKNLMDDSCSGVNQTGSISESSQKYNENNSNKKNEAWFVPLKNDQIQTNSDARKNVGNEHNQLNDSTYKTVPNNVMSNLELPKSIIHDNFQVDYNGCKTFFQSKKNVEIYSCNEKSTSSREKPLFPKVDEIKGVAKKIEDTSVLLHSDISHKLSKTVDVENKKNCNTHENVYQELLQSSSLGTHVSKQRVQITKSKQKSYIPINLSYIRIDTKNKYNKHDQKFAKIREITEERDSNKIFRSKSQKSLKSTTSGRTFVFTRSKTQMLKVSKSKEKNYENATSVPICTKQKNLSISNNNSKSTFMDTGSLEIHANREKEKLEQKIFPESKKQLFSNNKNKINQIKETNNLTPGLDCKRPKTRISSPKVHYRNNNDILNNVQLRSQTIAMQNNTILNTDLRSSIWSLSTTSLTSQFQFNESKSNANLCLPIVSKKTHTTNLSPKSFKSLPSSRNALKLLNDTSRNVALPPTSESLKKHPSKIRSQIPKLFSNLNNMKNNKS